MELKTFIDHCVALLGGRQRFGDGAPVEQLHRSDSVTVISKPPALRKLQSYSSRRLNVPVHASEPVGPQSIESGRVDQSSGKDAADVKGDSTPWLSVADFMQFSQKLAVVVKSVGKLVDRNRELVNQVRI